jgi:hypothetical protein
VAGLFCLPFRGALEQIQKEEQAEHSYYKGPVFIKLVQDVMQNFITPLQRTGTARDS